MGMEKLFCYNLKQNQHKIEFDSNASFESLLEDIKSFKLFLRLICNKYTLKKLSNKSNEIEPGKTAHHNVDNMNHKLEKADVEELACNLLNKLEKMKIWEIFNQIHLKNDNSIRNDIMHLMNILENKLGLNNKGKVEGNIKEKSINLRNDYEMSTVKVTTYSNFFKKHESDVTDKKKHRYGNTKSKKYPPCIFLPTSKILDFKMLKNCQSDVVSNSLGSTSNMSVLSNRTNEDMKKCVGKIIENDKTILDDTSSNFLKFLNQTEKSSMKENNSLKSQRKASTSKVIQPEVEENTTNKDHSSIIKSSKLHDFLHNNKIFDLDSFVHDKGKSINNNSKKTSKEKLKNHNLRSNLVEKMTCLAYDTEQSKLPKTRFNSFSPPTCKCELHNSSTILDIENYTNKVQKLTKTDNGTNGKGIDSRPSTLTVQNVIDMLLSISMRLNNIPICIKNKRIMDLNPPESMKEVIYILSYFDKYTEDINNEIKDENVSKSAYEKSHKVLQDFMFLLGSSLYRR